MLSVVTVHSSIRYLIEHVLGLYQSKLLSIDHLHHNQPEKPRGTWELLQLSP